MKIYMPSPFPPPLMSGWPPGWQLDVDCCAAAPARPEMMAHLADADVVVLNLDDVFDREMIDAAPRLKVIALFAGSTYNIDVEHAKRRGITICAMQGEIFENTADLTFALLMAVARRIPEADAFVRRGEYTRWHADLLLGGDIYGKTLGILGLGAIGTAVARRAQGFSMKLLYTAAHGPKPELEQQLGCSFVSLERLLEESDFLSLHCKLDDSTHHIINADRLRRMKPSAYLVNTGRGALVDESALAEALAKKVIAGAALDVFEFEPQVTKALMELPNVVMTPHLGASTMGNRLSMAEILKQAILDALAGRPSPHHV